MCVWQNTAKKEKTRPSSAGAAVWGGRAGGWEAGPGRASPGANRPLPGTPPCAPANTTHTYRNARTPLHTTVPSNSNSIPSIKNVHPHLPPPPPPGSLFNKYPFDLPTEAFTFDVFKQAFAAVQASTVHLQVWGGGGRKERLGGSGAEGEGGDEEGSGGESGREGEDRVHVPEPNEVSKKGRGGWRAWEDGEGGEAEGWRGVVPM